MVKLNMMMRRQKAKLFGTFLGTLLGASGVGIYTALVIFPPLTLAAIAITGVLLGAMAGNLLSEILYDLFWPPKMFRYTFPDGKLFEAPMAEFATAKIIYGEGSGYGNPYLPVSQGRDYPMLLPVPSSDSFNNVRLTPSPTPTK